MTVRVVTLFRGWQWIAWACGKCAAAKKRQGWSVDVGKVVDWDCDFCGKGAK